MKITKRQLRRIIKEEMINEGFFDTIGDLGRKAMDKLGIGADDVSEEVSSQVAQEALDKAFFQYAVSLTSDQFPDGDYDAKALKAAQLKAVKYVQGLASHQVMM